MPRFLPVQITGMVARIKKEELIGVTGSGGVSMASVYQLVNLP